MMEALANATCYSVNHVAIYKYQLDILHTLNLLTVACPLCLNLKKNKEKKSTYTMTGNYSSLKRTYYYPLFLKKTNLGHHTHYPVEYTKH